MQNLVLILVATGLIVLQILIGGARPADALPGYLIIAVAGLVVVALRKTPRVRPDAFCLLTTAGFAGYVILRALFSPVPYLARADLFMTMAALVIYLVCTLYLSGTHHRFTMTLILALAGIAHVALGVAQFAGQSNVMLLPWIFRPDYGFRASGFYISPNHLAALLGMLGVLTLCICCWSRVALHTRAFAFYGFIMCLIGIAITGSRGGYYSTAAGLGFFTLISIFLARRFNRPNFFGLAVATAFVITCFVAAVLCFVVQSEVFEKRLRYVGDPSWQAKLLAPAARQQLRLQPAFGTGSGTFLYFGRQFHGPEVQNDPQHVHNDYLELLAEYGWTGAALFAAFLLAHLAAAIGGVRRVLNQKLAPTAWTASNELALLVGALSALVIGLAHASRDFTFHLPANTSFAAFLFAILANPTVETAGRDQRRPYPFWVAWTTPLTALLLLAVAAPRLWPEVLAENARLALRDHDYPASLDFAHRAERADAGNPNSFYLDGEASHFLALESSDAKTATALRREAATAFESGLKLFPQDVRLLLKLGEVLDDLGEPARAGEFFARALEAAPNSGTVDACYGLHWHRQWALGKARRFYETAQSLGETQFSSAGLHDLEHDEAVLRSNDAFSDLLPDRPEPAEAAAKTAVP